MIGDIKLLISNKKLRKEFDPNGREYVKQNHSIRWNINEFEKCLKDHLQ